MRRVDWIDVAKGLAIILIVMLHARDYALSLIPPSPEHPIRWSSIDPFLRFIRLPLFFLISGMLASGVFSSGRGEARYNVRRTVSLAMVYLLWATALLILIPDWPNEGWRLPKDMEGYAGLLRGGSPLWYLWATVVAFGVAWILRPLPSLAVVMIAALVGIWLHREGDWLGGAFGPLGRLLPYYLLGIRYPVALLWLARWRSPLGFSAMACAYSLMVSFLPDGLRPDVLCEILGIAMAIIGICWLTEKWPRVMARIGWLGRRTLPIYIFHFPLLAWLGTAAVRHGAGVAQWPGTLWLFLPLLSATVIGISLALSAGVQLVGLGWSLPLPGRKRKEAAKPALLAAA